MFDFCKQNLNSKDSWEGAELPLKSGIIWESSSFQSDTHVYLSLSRYLSICTYYWLIVTIIQHTFSSL